MKNVVPNNLSLKKVKVKSCDKVFDSVIKKLDLEISALTEKLDKLMGRRANRLQLNIWKAENLKVIKVKDRYGYVQKMLESEYLALKLNYKESDEEFHLTRVM